MEFLKWMFNLSYWDGSQRDGDRNDLYMEEFQIQAMKTSPYQLNQCYWYVDDSETFRIIL